MIARSAFTSFVFFQLYFGFHLIASLISFIALIVAIFILFACLHMPTGIGIPKWIIANIAIPIPALWVRRVRHNRVRAQKVARIRRTRPIQPLTKKTGLKDTQPLPRSATSSVAWIYEAILILRCLFSMHSL